jgi:hypothetical protein
MQLTHQPVRSTRRTSSPFRLRRRTQREFAMRGTSDGPAPWRSRSESGPPWPFPASHWPVQLSPGLRRPRTQPPPTPKEPRAPIRAPIPGSNPNRCQDPRHHRRPRQERRRRRPHPIPVRLCTPTRWVAATLPRWSSAALAAPFKTRARPPPTHPTQRSSRNRPRHRRRPQPTPGRQSRHSTVRPARTNRPRRRPCGSARKPS